MNRTVQDRITYHYEAWQIHAGKLRATKIPTFEEVMERHRRMKKEETEIKC